MSKWRTAARSDSNQPGIVKALRKIPGVTVETGKDDIIVGRDKKTFWFEIKEPSTVSNKTDKVRPSAIKPSQHKLLAEWTGNYNIVWTVEQILEEIGL